MITISSSTSHIFIDMGSYYPVHPVKRVTFRKDKVVLLLENTNHVELVILGGHTWGFVFDDIGVGYKVATLNAVAPTSNADLYDKLFAMVTA